MRLTAAFAFGLTALCCLAAKATPLDAAQARTVVERMQADRAWARAYATCPVALPRKRAPAAIAGEAASNEICAAAPLGCFVACEKGSGKHCYALARSFQIDETFSGHVWEQLFAAACAGGDASGCTTAPPESATAATRTIRSARCARPCANRACAGALSAPARARTPGAARCSDRPTASARGAGAAHAQRATPMRKPASWDPIHRPAYMRPPGLPR